MNLAPIVLFVYNRLEYTRQTIDALLANPLAKESELFIYSDASKEEKTASSVQEVREYIHHIRGFKQITIIERERNFGLADSIIDGVTRVVNQYGKIIVLEDDLLVNPYFLQYMNDALNLYAHEEKVACISAFNYPLEYPYPLKEESFFIKGADCWGWATWDRAWKNFQPNGSKLLKLIQSQNLQKDFDFNHSYPYTQMLINQIKGKNNSWAIRWYASAFLLDQLCLYPTFSLVENIGIQGTHFHTKHKSEIFGKRSQSPIKLVKIPIQEDKNAKAIMEDFLRSQKRFRQFCKRIMNFLGIK